MVKKTLVRFLPLVIVFFIFKNWFFFPFLSARDFPYFFWETLSDFSLFPPSWSSTSGMGFGGELVNYGLGSYVYFIVSVFVKFLGLPWEFVYKVFIFGLFIILSVFSSTYLLRKVLGSVSSLQLLLSAVIFTANTYILMVVGGGQMGVALAYAIAPLVLARFIKIIHNSSFIIHHSALAGLVLAVQVLFDLRIAFVTMVAVALYFVLNIKYQVSKNNIHNTYYMLLNTIVVPLGITAMLHTYWLLPVLILRSHPAAEILSSFSSVEIFRFFSFATFSQSLSFLHPNWPENIFGKVYFMRPEFLLLPILAFFSLILINLKLKTQNSKLQLKTQNFNNPTIKQFNNGTIIFFALLGLIGAFLAKGANPPFGQANEFLFQYFPGMNMFRDPTKFYLLTALSYLVLIPFSISSLTLWINSKFKVQNAKLQFKIQKLISYAFPLLTIFYLLFLINPVLLGQLNGTFKQHEIPKEYINLKDFLHSQLSFSRTLWVPTQQRYNYYSYMHPAVSADNLFSATNSADIIRKLSEEQAHEFLSNLSIQYIIIPYDSFGEIFVEDRKYNESEYLATIKLVDKIAWLKKIEGFGKIAVYEVPSYKDHFWMDGEGSLSYMSVSPSTYGLEVSIDKASNLIFTDSYSSYWVAIIDGKEIRSEKTAYNINNFPLEKTGRYKLTIDFSKQKYYTYGRVITLLFIASLLFVVIYSRKKINL